MKFKLVESLDNQYYRITAVNDTGKQVGGLFRGLNSLVRELWDEDNPLYDEINEPLSELEYHTNYPESFDYPNAKFAYKESKYKELHETILDLKAGLQKIDWDLEITKLNKPDNIVYEDSDQIAYI